MLRPLLLLLTTAILVAGKNETFHGNTASIAKPQCSPGSGQCPDGSVCFKNYSGDISSKYNANCGLLASRPLEYTCHDSRDDIKYSQCESFWLDKLLSNELDKIVGHLRLERGQKCEYDIESSIRTIIENDNNESKINKYRILSWFEKSKLSGGSAEGGLCDSTKLLECTSDGICECTENTEPRKVTIDKEYQSDYCYLTEDQLKDKAYCHGELIERMRLAETEGSEFWEHYGNASSGALCNNGNLCVFIRAEEEKCTSEDTGKTGYDLEPDVYDITTSAKRKNLTKQPDRFGGAGWRMAGESSSDSICSNKPIILLSLLIGSIRLGL